MKKIVFVLAAALLCFQFAGISQTRVGLAGGISAANMHGSKAEGGSGRGGIMTSFIVEKSFAKSFAFRPSVSYVQKGQTRPNASAVIDKTYIALRYVEFNPDFLFYVSGNEGGFFIGAAPSIAFNLPSKTVSETDGVKTTKSIEFGKEGTAFMRGTDWGANFTAGFRSKSGFLFNFNYNHGFRNLAIDGDPGELKNSYFGVQVGVFLNNGKDK